MRLISLFAGIGAMEFAAKRVFDDVEIVAAAEMIFRQIQKALDGESKRDTLF